MTRRTLTQAMHAAMAPAVFALPAPVSAGDDAPAPCWYYGAQRVALRADTARVAVFDAAQTEAQRAQRLRHHALEARPSGALPVAGWTLAAARRGREDAAAALCRAARGARPCFAFVSPVYFDDLGGPLVIKPEVLVGFDASLTPGAAEALVRALELDVVERDWDGVVGLWRLASRAPHAEAVLAQANALAFAPGVSFAEPGRICTGQALRFPNDPLFGNQWGLHNTGQAGGTPNEDIDAPEAWDLTWGDPRVIVVVLDTGVQPDHPDLHVWGGADFTGQGGGGAPGNPCDRHGTAVAGCIAAIANNGIGGCGVAPGARVASARVGVSSMACDDTFTTDPAWVVNAINWSVSIGASVTNCSLALGSPSAAIDAAYTNAKNSGLLHYAAAGDNGQPVLAYPASSSSVTGVAAIDRNGSRASFSNYKTQGQLYAPGQDITTTDITGSGGYAAGDYAVLSGTSYASAYAAGVAALRMTVEPTVVSGIGFGQRTQGLDIVDAWKNVRDNSVWVDFSYTGATQNGTFDHPYKTLVAGVNATQTGNTVAIKPGTSNERPTLNRSVRLRAWSGLARVGE